MRRTILGSLKAWKNSPYRKPLILSGARQVGKTYILKEFGRQEYQHVAYINCDGNSEIADIFARDYDMQWVLMVIGAISKQPILPGKTLIILDAGLTYRISRVRDVGMPLKFYEDLNAFKPFLLDVFTYYYSREDSRMGIDFVVQHKGQITPIEVKAEENLRSKSLRFFVDSHKELHAVRFSMSPYKEQEWMTNIPLYGIGESL